MPCVDCPWNMDTTRGSMARLIVLECKTARDLHRIDADTTSLLVAKAMMEKVSFCFSFQIVRKHREVDVLMVPWRFPYGRMTDETTER